MDKAYSSHLSRKLFIMVGQVHVRDGGKRGGNISYLCRHDFNEILMNSLNSAMSFLTLYKFCLHRYKNFPPLFPVSLTRTCPTMVKTVCTNKRRISVGHLGVINLGSNPILLLQATVFHIQYVRIQTSLLMQGRGHAETGFGPFVRIWIRQKWPGHAQPCHICIF